MSIRSSLRISDLFVIRDSDSARSEIRQFLLALACFAFVLAALGAGQYGADAFAKDIILVFSGAWCANQLIRGPEIFKSQVICVFQAYLVGVLCCAVLLFAVGWLVFLPEEYENLGQALLFAATFTTNFGHVFFPADTGLRFDGLFDHLWIPALIAQCGLILTGLFWLLSHNNARLIAALAGLAGISLLLSLIDTPMVQILPIGGLWAFLVGALPFVITSRYRVLELATLTGVINIVAGVFAIVAFGDTLLSRALVAIGLAFLYLGSRPKNSPLSMTGLRRRWFGMMLHTFLWAVPLLRINSGLSIVEQSQPYLVLFFMLCVLLALISWSIWQHIEERSGTNRLVISGVVAIVILLNGVIGLMTNGLQVRFPASAQAYLHELQSPDRAFSCPKETGGPLAGLNVCRLGPEGPPKVLVWGDHQLNAIRIGFAEAARRTNMPTLLIAQSNCVPLGGVQSRFPAGSHLSGQDCDRQSAQVLQALPHLKSIRQVTLVADWAYYLEMPETELVHRAMVRIGPMDGSPFDVNRQADYVTGAARNTLQALANRGLRVSVLRQVPSHPMFDVEIAARSSLPGAGLYFGMPKVSTSVSLEEVTARHAQIDTLFQSFAATGLATYVDTWSAFCSDTRCDVRGGLSTDYVTSTQLSSSGALSLAQILAVDVKRASTHAPYRRPLDS